MGEGPDQDQVNNIREVSLGWKQSFPQPIKFEYFQNLLVHPDLTARVCPLI